MTTKADKTNWYKIAIGSIFFFAALFSANKSDISGDELTTKTIVVKSPVRNIHRRRSNDEYSISALNYGCSFIIRTPGVMAAKGQDIANITQNDTLLIHIRNSRVDDLNNKSKDIPIYTLIKNNHVIYGLAAYNESQAILDKRWNIVFIMMGSLFLLRGLALISSKAGYILGGLAALTIIVLRILHIWW
ncbi:MAG: hypothetical protein V4538_12030 [Bacteroidota bacterium]